LNKLKTVGENRQRAAALQDADAPRRDHHQREASWSAPVLWSFGLRQGSPTKLRRKLFEVRQMVAVPAGQSVVADRFTNFKTAHLHPVVWVLSLETTVLNRRRQDLLHLFVREYLSFLDALWNDKGGNTKVSCPNHDPLLKLYAWHDGHQHHREDARQT